MTIDLSKLKKNLVKKLVDEVEDEWSDLGSFTPDHKGEAETMTVVVGKWLCIKILVNYSGRTMDQSTSRALGDPEDAHAWYDWIGLEETAPEKLAKLEEINNWADISTYYRVTFRDVQHPGPFGHHDGRMVKIFTPDGKGEIYEVEEKRFKDVSPLT
ncbi:MAG: hypothetical protein ACTSYW_00665, partial [Candidatus Heimdallarchaeota archaeon]